MNRSDFLRGLGALPAAAILPATTSGEPAPIDPEVLLRLAVHGMRIEWVAPLYSGGVLRPAHHGARSCWLIFDALAGNVRLALRSNQEACPICETPLEKGVTYTYLRERGEGGLYNPEPGRTWCVCGYAEWPKPEGAETYDEALEIWRKP